MATQIAEKSHTQLEGYVVTIEGHCVVLYPEKLSEIGISNSKDNIQFTTVSYSLLSYNFDQGSKQDNTVTGEILSNHDMQSYGQVENFEEKIDEKLRIIIPLQNSVDLCCKMQDIQKEWNKKATLSIHCDVALLSASSVLVLQCYAMASFASNPCLILPLYTNDYTGKSINSFLVGVIRISVRISFLPYLLIQTSREDTKNKFIKISMQQAASIYEATSDNLLRRNQIYLQHTPTSSDTPPKLHTEEGIQKVPMSDRDSFRRKSKFLQNTFKEGVPAQNYKTNSSSELWTGRNSNNATVRKVVCVPVATKLANVPDIAEETNARATLQLVKNEELSKKEQLYSYLNQLMNGIFADDLASRMAVGRRNINPRNDHYFSHNAVSSHQYVQNDSRLLRSKKPLRTPFGDNRAQQVPAVSKLKDKRPSLRSCTIPTLFSCDSKSKQAILTLQQHESKILRHYYRWYFSISINLPVEMPQKSPRLALDESAVTDFALMLGLKEGPIWRMYALVKIMEEIALCFDKPALITLHGIQQQDHQSYILFLSAPINRKKISNTEGSLSKNKRSSCTLPSLGHNDMLHATVTQLTQMAWKKRPNCAIITKLCVDPIPPANSTDFTSSQQPIKLLRLLQSSPFNNGRFSQNEDCQDTDSTVNISNAWPVRLLAMTKTAQGTRLQLPGRQMSENILKKSSIVTSTKQKFTHFPSWNFGSDATPLHSTLLIWSQNPTLWGSSTLATLEHLRIEQQTKSSVIKVVMDQNSRKYAIKCVRMATLRNTCEFIFYMQSLGESQACKDLDKNAELTSSIIVPLLALYMDHQTVYLVTPYIGNCVNLRQHLIRHPCIPEAAVRKWAMQLTAQLHHLHSHHLCYYNLYPDKIFLVDATKQNAILSLPSTKRWCKYVEMPSVTGTCKTKEKSWIFPVPLAYFPPEAIQFAEKTKCVDTATLGTHSDIWMLGILIFQLLAGKPPFCSLSLKNISALISKGTLGESLLQIPRCTNICKDFIASLLIVDKEKRPCCKSLLQHEWIRSVYVNRRM